MIPTRRFPTLEGFLFSKYISKEMTIYSSFLLEDLYIHVCTIPLERMSDG